jgi:hypothetical protein
MFLQKRGQLIEALIPEPLIAIEPLMGLAHRLGAQAAGDGTAGLLPREQAGLR